MRRSMIICCVLALLVVSLGLMGFAEATRAADPEQFAREYLLAQMEALVKQDSTLIDEYFNLDDPVSRELHQFESFRVQYVAEYLSHAVKGISWYSSEMELKVLRGNLRWVEIEAAYSGIVQTNDMEEPTVFNDERHILTLRRDHKGEWYVLADEHEDIFIRAYGRVSEDQFASIIRGQQEYWNERKAEQSKNVASGSLSDMILAREKMMEHALEEASNSRSYQLVMLSRTDASTYAKTYASSYNTQVFPSFSADCQNFVSQALWFGFGGTNSHPVSSGYPMVKDIQGSTNWWASKNPLGNSTSWTYVPSFCTMIEDNFYSTSKYGVCGLRTPNGGLSTGALLPGDIVVDVKSHEGGQWGTRGHIMIITSIRDHGGGINDIYISAHTNNAKDKRLILEYGPSAQYRLRFAYIYYLRKPF